MKRLKLFLTATVLTLVLVTPAFAGDMETTVTSQPPPPTVTVGGRQTTVTVTSGTSNETADIHPMTEIAINLLQSMLSLF